ncbi:28 kDa heat- and acid-stable phosphoprotein-like [Daphnia pulex]|uniref:28 kDa heat- and acid-stable phosphoprotein-like n=1 Tax=Daphnia pulex TaxID=6669 RepID=UPI001EDD22BB|nr:28 kDa heat- and acid-stable phosphoprotein-like [Daphnia pulex]XP_046653687.1 28 kDa heat- and acid-stable phosphoprotein-like [Daphnia pulicaria]
MPRGGKVNKKGRARHFTSPEELERQRKEDQRNWRAKQEEASDSDSNESKSEKSGSGSGSESEEEAVNGKGPTPAVDIENPNHVVKQAKKVGDLDVNDATKPELSRREREEIDKQKAREHYQKLHAQGKTDEARADLARLAIIRQQREEAAKKRDDEKKMKEAVAAAKTASIQKAIGKRT